MSFPFSPHGTSSQTPGRAAPALPFGPPAAPTNRRNPFSATRLSEAGISQFDDIAKQEREGEDAFYRTQARQQSAAAQQQKLIQDANAEQEKQRQKALELDVTRASLQLAKAPETMTRTQREALEKKQLEEEAKVNRSAAATVAAATRESPAFNERTDKSWLPFGMGEEPTPAAKELQDRAAAMEAPGYTPSASDLDQYRKINPTAFSELDSFKSTLESDKVASEQRTAAELAVARAKAIKDGLSPEDVDSLLGKPAASSAVEADTLDIDTRKASMARIESEVNSLATRESELTAEMQKGATSTRFDEIKQELATVSQQRTAKAAELTSQQKQVQDSAAALETKKKAQVEQSLSGQNPAILDTALKTAKVLADGSFETSQPEKIEALAKAGKKVFYSDGKQDAKPPTDAIRKEKKALTESKIKDISETAATLRAGSLKISENIQSRVDRGDITKEQGNAEWDSEIDAYSKQNEAKTAELGQYLGDAIDDFKAGTIDAATLNAIYHAAGQPETGVEAFKEHKAKLDAEDAHVEALSKVMLGADGSGKDDPTFNGQAMALTAQIEALSKDAEEKNQKYNDYDLDRNEAGLSEGEITSMEMDADQSNRELAVTQKKLADMRSEQRSKLKTELVRRGVPEDEHAGLIARAELSTPAPRVDAATAIEARGGGVKGAAGAVIEKLPYVGGFAEIARLVPYATLAAKLEKGETLSGEELDSLTEFVRYSGREGTTAMKIVEGVATSLSFGVEMAGATTGVGAGVTATRKAAAEAVKKGLTWATTKEGIKRLAQAKAETLLKGGVTGGTVAKAIVAKTLKAIPQTAKFVAGTGANKTLAAYVNEKATQGIGVTEQEGKIVAALDRTGSLTGEARHSQGRMMVDAIFGQAKEFTTEKVGAAMPLLGKVLGRSAPKAAAAWQGLTAGAKAKISGLAMVRALQKLNPAKQTGDIGRFLRAAGQQGLGMEILEERIGDVADAAYGWFQDGKFDLKLPTAENFAVEVATMLIPMGAGAVQSVRADNRMNKAIADSDAESSARIANIFGDPDATAADMAARAPALGVTPVDITNARNLIGPIETTEGVRKSDQRHIDLLVRASKAEDAGDMQKAFNLKQMALEESRSKADMAMSDVFNAVQVNKQIGGWRDAAANLERQAKASNLDPKDKKGLDDDVKEMKADAHLASALVKIARGLEAELTKDETKSLKTPDGPAYEKGIISQGAIDRVRAFAPSVEAFIKPEQEMKRRALVAKTTGDTNLQNGRANDLRPGEDEGIQENVEIGNSPNSTGGNPSGANNVGARAQSVRGNNVPLVQENQLDGRVNGTRQTEGDARTVGNALGVQGMEEREGQEGNSSEIGTDGGVAGSSREQKGAAGNSTSAPQKASQDSSSLISASVGLVSPAQAGNVAPQVGGSSAAAASPSPSAAPAATQAPAPVQAPATAPANAPTNAPAGKVWRVMGSDTFVDIPHDMAKNADEAQKIAIGRRTDPQYRLPEDERPTEVQEIDESQPSGTTSAPSGTTLPPQTGTSVPQNGQKQPSGTSSTQPTGGAIDRKTFIAEKLNEALKNVGAAFTGITFNKSGKRGAVEPESESVNFDLDAIDLQTLEITDPAALQLEIEKVVEEEVHHVETVKLLKRRAKKLGKKHDDLAAESWNDVTPELRKRVELLYNYGKSFPAGMPDSSKGYELYRFYTQMAKSGQITEGANFPESIKGLSKKAYNELVGFLRDLGTWMIEQLPKMPPAKRKQFKKDVAAVVKAVKALENYAKKSKPAKGATDGGLVSGSGASTGTTDAGASPPSSAAPADKAQTTIKASSQTDAERLLGPVSDVARSLMVDGWEFAQNDTRDGSFYLKKGGKFKHYNADGSPFDEAADVAPEKPASAPKSSTQFTLSPADAKPILDFGASIPKDELFTSIDPEWSDGALETEPHVTVLYGLTKHEAAPVAKAIKDHGPVTVTLGKLSIFENGEYDVLKIDVEGPELRSLNAKLSKLPNENSFPDYRPHMTIAYLKKGEGKKYVGDTRFEGQTITFDTMTFSPPSELRGKLGKPELPLTPSQAIQPEVRENPTPEEKAELEELDSLMERRGQAQNKVKGATFSKKDEARFQELGAKLRRFLFETVDAANDAVVGEDINGQPIRQSKNGTLYTVENGRVRTAPAFKPDPEYSRQQDELLAKQKAAPVEGDLAKLKRTLEMVQSDIGAHEDSRLMKGVSDEMLQKEATRLEGEIAKVEARIKPAAKDQTAPSTWRKTHTVTKGGGKLPTGTPVEFIQDSVEKASGFKTAIVRDDKGRDFQIDPDAITPAESPEMAAEPKSPADLIRQHLDADDAASALAVFDGMTKDEINKTAQAVFGRGFYNNTKAEMLSALKQWLPDSTKSVMTALAKQSAIASAKRALKTAKENQQRHSEGILGMPTTEQAFKSVSDAEGKDPHGIGKEAVAKAWQKEVDDAQAKVDELESAPAAPAPESPEMAAEPESREEVAPEVEATAPEVTGEQQTNQDVWKTLEFAEAVAMKGAQVRDKRTGKSLGKLGNVRGGMSGAIAAVSKPKGTKLLSSLEILVPTTPSQSAASPNSFEEIGDGSVNSLGASIRPTNEVAEALPDIPNWRDLQTRLQTVRGDKDAARAMMDAYHRDNPEAQAALDARKAVSAQVGRPIPPAWTEVRIYPPGGRLLAKGRDDKSRLQSIYSSADTAAALASKFERAKRVNDLMPRIIAGVNAGLSEGTEESSVLRLIYLTGFRNGGEGDTGAKVKAYGATTLLDEHVNIDGDVVTFDFIGKLGVQQQHTVIDAGLADDLRSRKASGGRLFKTSPEKVLSTLRSVAGTPDIKVHDLRTWNATSLAAELVKANVAPKTEIDYWLKRDAVGDIVARKLGDTRKIVLESYIDPIVFENWQESATLSNGNERPKISRKQADARGASSQLGKPLEDYERALRDELLPPFGQRSRVEPRRGLASLSSSKRPSASDAEYMAAVEAGDMEKAQKMVDEAAKAAGYNVKAYHGTPDANFDVFKEDQFFTEDEKYAKRFTDSATSSSSFYGVRKAQPRVLALFLKTKKVFDTRIPKYAKLLKDKFSGKYGEGVLTEMGLPDWVEGRDIAEFLRDEIADDFDAVIVDEGKDNSGQRPPAYIVFNPSQIKSADPVTRDESGAVIPLSQRFNPESNSILYSATRPARLGIDDDVVADALDELDALPESERERVNKIAGYDLITNEEQAAQAAAIKQEGTSQFYDETRDRENHKAWSKWANDTYNADPEGSIRKIVLEARNGFTGHSGQQAKLAMLVLEKLSRKAAFTGDPQMLRDVEAVTLAFDLRSTLAGREIAARWQPHATMEEQHRTTIAKAIFGPTGETRRKLDEAMSRASKNERIRELEAQVTKLLADLKARQAKPMKPAEKTTFVTDKKTLDKLRKDLERVKLAKTEAELLAEQNQTRLDEVREMFEESGFTMEEVMIGEVARLKLQSSPMVKKVLESFNPMERVAIRAIIEGKSDRAASVESKISRRENIRKVEARFDEALNNELDAWIDRGFTPDDMDRPDFASFMDKKGKLFASIRPQPGGITMAQRQKLRQSWRNAIHPPARVRNNTARKRLKSKKGKGAGLRIRNPQHAITVMRVLQREDTSGFDRVYEYWINGILSGIGTHTANVAGNMANVMLEYGLQRWVEAGANMIIGDAKGATAGELITMSKWVAGAAVTAFKQAKEAWNYEVSSFDWDAMGTHPKLDSLSVDGKTGFIHRLAIAGTKGRIIRIPSRALLFMDEFTKYFVGTIEAAAQGHRIAKAEKLTGAAFDDRVNELVRIPGSPAWVLALEKAQEMTFQQDLPKMLADAQKLLNAKSKSKLGATVRFALKMIFPFIKTPYNILAAGLRKSPLGSVRLAGKAVTGGYKGKGAELSHDLAEQVIAAFVMMLVSGMAEGDPDDDKKPILITGTRGRDDRSEANFLNRSKGGETTVLFYGKPVFHYGRFAPLAVTVATIVNSLREMKKIPNGKDKIAVASSIFGDFVNTARSQTFLAGFDGLVNFVNSLSRESEGAEVQKAVKFLMNGAIPNIVRQTTRNLDEQVRDSKNAPWYYHAVPYGDLAEPLYDLYGRPAMKGGTALSRLFVTEPARVESVAPADVLLGRWNQLNPVQKEGDGSSYFPSDLTKASFKFKDSAGKYQDMTPAEIREFRRRVGVEISTQSAGLSTVPIQENIDELKKIRGSAAEKVKKEMFGGGVRPVLKSAPSLSQLLLGK